MKTLLTLFLALSFVSCQTSCSTTGQQGDPSIILTAGVTYLTARAVQGHPEKAVRLREAADALDVIADGVVNRETITTLLTAKLGKNDPALTVLITLVVSYFAPADVVIPQSKLAKDVANAIRAGLPAV